VLKKAAVVREDEALDARVVGCWRRRTLEAVYEQDSEW
jgi:hypothetical protein